MKITYLGLDFLNNNEPYAKRYIDLLTVKETEQLLEAILERY